MSEDLRDIFSNLAFWTALSPHEIPVWVTFEGFGFRQPNVRKSAWGLVQSLLKLRHGKSFCLLRWVSLAQDTDELDPLVPILSTVILRSSWVEMDASVQGVMWQPLLTFLKGILN